MKDRLVSFTVDHPQLEFSPRQGHFGKKKAQVWKNLGSPALLLGSLHVFSPTNSLAPSPLPAFSRVRSPHSESPIPKHNQPNQSLHDMFTKFPRFTRANPKFVPTNPIVEPSVPRRRMGDLATNIILNRNNIG